MLHSLKPSKQKSSKEKLRVCLVHNRKPRIMSLMTDNTAQLLRHIMFWTLISLTVVTQILESSHQCFYLIFVH